MKILISGSKGLIGSHLKKELSKDHEVWGFDRGGIEGDKPLPEKLDFVIHTAANTFIRETIKNPVLAQENINITLDMFEIARAKKANMIYFSSSRVNHPFLNPYVMSKLCGETIAKSYEQTYGVKSLILRPETIWGYAKDERVMVKWIRQAMEGSNITIYGNKNKELPPLYIDEFVKIFIELLNNFDFYSGKSISISGQIRKAEDIAKDIISVVGKGGYKFMKPEKLQPQKCYSTGIVGKSDLKSEVRKVVNKIKNE